MRDTGVVLLRFLSLLMVGASMAEPRHGAANPFVDDDIWMGRQHSRRARMAPIRYPGRQVALYGVRGVDGAPYLPVAELENLSPLADSPIVPAKPDRARTGRQRRHRNSNTYKSKYGAVGGTDKDYDGRRTQVHHHHHFHAARDPAHKWFGQCVPRPGHATFFIPVDEPKIIKDYALRGGLLKADFSCSACPTGSQFSYPGASHLPADNDVDRVVGTFSCASNADICLEDTQGQKFVGFGPDLIMLLPTPVCGEQGCAMHLMMDTENVSDRPNNGIKRVGTAESSGITVASQFVDGVRNMSESYIKVRGFNCGGCNSPIAYCDRLLSIKDVIPKIFSAL